MEVPPDCLSAVLAALGPRDRARARRVCPTWNKTVAELRTSAYQSGELVHSLNDLDDGFPSLALDPHGELLVGFSLGPPLTVCVWSMTTLRRLHEWPVVMTECSRVSFSDNTTSSSSSTFISSLWTCAQGK